MSRNTVCIDTNIWIYFFAHKEPFSQKLEDLITDKMAVTTAINIAELYAGTKSQNEENFIGSIIEAIPIIEITTESARLAGNIQKKLIQEKKKQGFADCLIAACCLIHNISLFTHNARDFQNIDTLSLLSI